MLFLSDQPIWWLFDCYFNLNLTVWTLIMFIYLFKDINPLMPGGNKKVTHT